MRTLRILLILLGVALLSRLASGHAQVAERQLWLYYPTNFLVDENLPKLETVWHRAAAAGYTHVLLVDSKFAKLGDLGGGTAKYLRNAERARKLAAELKLELVPAIFGIGYSNNLLWHDQNLIEAMPVKEAPLTVKGGVAHLDDPQVPTLPPTGFADLKKWGFHDDSVVAEPNNTIRMDANGKNARISTKLKVQPYRQYHLSFRLKTDKWAGRAEVKVFTPDGRNLTWDYLQSKATQDWTEQQDVFNSLANTEVTLYLGGWGVPSGKAWWADLKLEEVAFVNLVRRSGAPLVITTTEGQPLVEGRDYQPLVDPLMGSKPWKGEYDVYHQPPLLATKLPDGTRLKASYYHAVTVHDHQAGVCLSEPKTLELLRDEARRVHAVFGAKNYMMSHDEARVLNWCEACQKRQLTPGQLLADNVRSCVQILHEVAPGAQLHVWSDMFDPNHNAVKGPYYLVNGTLEGSWEGVDPSVTILPWYYGQRAASLAFFAQRGNKQVIAGYYDSQPERIADWLASAQPYPQSVVGVMYTTWENKYADLEKFAEIAKAHWPR